MITCTNMNDKREAMVRGIVEKFDGFSVVKEDDKVCILKSDECTDSQARGMVQHLRHNYFDFKFLREGVIFAIDTLEYPEGLEGRFLQH